MEKLIKLLALFIAPFGTISYASAATATVSECVANHNRWEKDQCSKAKYAGPCDMSLSGARRIYVQLNATGRLSSYVPDPYQRQAVSGGWLDSSDLNFGGLIRGTAEIFSGRNGKSIYATEVYVNHDNSGNYYTLYRCQR